MKFTLNGQPIDYAGNPEQSLMEYLRDEKDIISPKNGCAPQAACGCCVVDIDGKAMLSCVTPMKKVADTYPDLFDDLVHIFSGRQVEEQFESDISVVLHPLPRIPIMVCYWKPDDGLASSLNLFFDKVADDAFG